MPSPTFSKYSIIELRGKSPTSLPVLGLGLARVAALDPVRHGLLSTSVQYLNPSVEAPNRSRRLSSPSPLSNMDETSGDPDANQQMIRVSGTASDPSGTTSTAASGPQPSAMSAPRAAASQDKTGSLSSAHPPLLGHTDDKRAVTTLPGDIYDSWEIVEHPSDYPEGVEAAPLSLVTGTSLVRCFYCLDPAVKGVECCGFIVDCWCSSCDITGESGQRCEFCDQELEVFQFPVC